MEDLEDAPPPPPELHMLGVTACLGLRIVVMSDVTPALPFSATFPQKTPPPAATNTKAMWNSDVTGLTYPTFGLSERPVLQ